MSDPLVPNIVTIAGVAVDVNDPCALCRALQAYKVRLATGGVVEEIEIRSPVTTRRTRFSAGSKMADLDAMIADAKAACEASLGTPPKRTRYAISARYRPY